MTIEDLQQKSAAELIAMTDAELNVILEPYLKFVRPSQVDLIPGFNTSAMGGSIVKKGAERKKTGIRSRDCSNMYEAILNKAKQMGIKV
jgi:hypothetical protein